MLAALALGSNLVSQFGKPAANLREAVRRVGDLGEVTAVSSFYETEPAEYLAQPRFINGAVLLETSLGPLDLLRGLLALEASMGRVRGADHPPKGPRVVDLDLVLYMASQAEGERGHSLVLNDSELTLPHPAMHKRQFVLEPLVEIAPGLRHPMLGRTMAELLAAL